MVLSLSQAEGDFALPDERPDTLLLISGGSGITPVMSMLRTLCHEGHRGPIAFLHYARDEHDVAYANALAELAAGHANVRLLRGFSRRPRAGELEGRFAREHVHAAGVDPDEALTFASGPTALLDAVRGIWAEDGLEQRLHVEQFAPPARPAVDPDGHVAGSVRFARSGVEAAGTAVPLLDQAEAAGPHAAPRLPHGHLPHLHLPQARGRRARRPHRRDLDRTRRADIQLCVSAPVGDVTLDL